MLINFMTLYGFHDNVDNLFIPGSISLHLLKPFNSV